MISIVNEIWISNDQIAKILELSWLSFKAVVKTIGFMHSLLKLSMNFLFFVVYDNQL